MKKHNFLRAVPMLALVLCLAVPSAATESTAVPDTSSQSFHIHGIGPGLQNLSPGDDYAVYQWALQNQGEFQLVELRNRFQEVDPFYAAVLDRARQEGVQSPAVGPGNYDAIRTTAVAGIDIRMRDAWDVYDSSTVSKRQVVVALIDTGVDINHPELKNAIWTNPGEIPGDGIDNNGNGFVDDYYGWNFFNNNNQVFVGSEDDHGTHAAGTIAASRGNRGMAGITDNNYVKIMPLKALGTRYGIGDAASVIAAIQYAEANGASICNLSFGTLTSYPELEAVIRRSQMLFIVSAGNGDYLGVGYDIDQSPVYPASYQLDNIITVSNLMFDGSLDTTSNFGLQSVDIAAPGSYILSCTSFGSYGFMSGTSMAAPMVTGAAAMLYSYRTDLSLADVKTILLSSARPLESLNGKMTSGGMLDVYAALTYSTSQ